MELRHIRYFVAVAEELHFGRAAERLFMAQPPLSQQIKALEKELGVLLFHRTKRRVELSEAGKKFLKEARHVLTQAERAVQAAQNARQGDTGHITIGFVGSAAYFALPSVLRPFRQRFPDIEPSFVELTTAEQIQAIRAHRLDVGLVRPPIFDSDLSMFTLAESEFILAISASHPSANRRVIDLAELQGEPFIMVRRQVDPTLYDPIINACQQTGFSPNVVQEVTQVHTILSLVSAGLGIALVPECARMLQWEGLAFLRVTGTATSSVALVWHPNNKSDALRSFIDLATTKAVLKHKLLALQGGN